MVINKKTLFAFVIPGTVLLLLLAYSRFSGPGPYDVKLTPLHEVKQAYELVVVGSDPEGIAAAVSGARNGLSVLLVDTRPELGGLFTRGWLNSLDMNYGPDGEILNEGLFLEFFKQIKGDSFDVDEARWVFNRLVMAEENLAVLLGVDAVSPVTEESPAGTKVRGVRIVTGGKQVTVDSGGVIDATQDGDMAALAGVPFSVGQEDIGRQSSYMAVTQVFKLTGVGWSDWLRLIYSLRYDGKKSTGANWHSAWGFSDITSQYAPSGDMVALRGLNIGRQRDGSLLINALLVFGVDPLAGNSRQKARDTADTELPLVITFMRENVPGLSNARLAGVALELYVRESRHIYAEYRLTLDDVLENRDFADRIAFGSYPVDIQPTGSGTPGVIIGKPKQYAVPFRCLVPQEVDGLLVVGRAAGYDTLAHGSARTVPVGMATGQAAGAAAALAQENNLTFRQLAADTMLIKTMQNRLNEQGVDLHPFSIENELANHWAYEGLKFVRRLGLAVGGYGNDYRLDEPIEHQRFLNILSRSVQQHGAVLQVPELYPEANTFNIYDASYALAAYLGLSLSKEDSYAYLQEQGFFRPESAHWAGYAGYDTPLTSGAAYMLLKDFIVYVGDPGDD